MPGIQCICCNRHEARFFFSRSGLSRRYTIYRCGFCKSAFVWPRPDPEEIEALYNSGNDPCMVIDDIQTIGDRPRYYPSGRHDADLVLRRCKRLTHGKSLLDVGAGTGDFSNVAVAGGFNVQACEPNAMSRKVFHRRNGFYPEPAMFTPDYAASLESDLDIVIVSHVLEHIAMPGPFVQNIRKVLANGGVAAVLVPHFGSALSRLQGKKDMFISPPEHLNFFSKTGLKYLFGRHGLSLEFVETTSKVNRQRLEQLVRIPVLSTLAWVWLIMALSCAHPIKMGMVINAYFRKT